MTPHVEGMSAFYLTVWESREGKFNENTSEVVGEMSAFSLITAFFPPGWTRLLLNMITLRGERC